MVGPAVLPGSSISPAAPPGFVPCASTPHTEFGAEDDALLPHHAHTLTACAKSFDDGQCLSVTN